MITAAPIPPDELAVLAVLAWLALAELDDGGRITEAGLAHLDEVLR